MIQGFGTPFSAVGRGQSSALERLASGRRINRGADDASGLAIGERLKALESAIDQGARNLADGSSVAAIADGGLGSTSESLQRMRELAVQAGNGTLSDADRESIQAEYDELAREVTRVGQSTSFNGRTLLDGSVSGDESIDIDDGTGEGADLSVSIGDHTAQGLGVAGLDVSDPSTLRALDSAIETTSNTRAKLGSLQNRIGSRIENHRTTSLNLADARSRIVDTDVAAEVANLTRDRLLQDQRIALRSHPGLASSKFLDVLL